MYLGHGARCGPEHVARIRLQVLSKIGALAGSLDREQLLGAIANILVPELADWSMLDLIDGDSVRRSEVPLWRRDARVSERVLAGQSVVQPSELFVPLVVGGRTVGVLIAAMTRHWGRHYDEEDLALAEEVARRAAQMIENAQLHEQLKANEARFRDALDHSNVVLYEQDLRGAFRWIYNPHLGYSVADVLGKRMDELDGMTISPTFEEVWQKVRDTGQRVQSELRVVRGAEVWDYVIDTDLLRDEHGEVIGIKGAATDVTEHRRTQRELAEALELKERIIGVLSHDLRTPLTAVLMSAALLKSDDGVTEAARRKIALVEGAAQRMTEMISTLLDFTRSRQGGLPVSPEPTDLREVIDRVVEELRTTHPDRVIEVTTHGDTRGDWDPARLGQAISNLAINALLHGDPHAPVSICAGQEGSTVRVEVRNVGSPIPPDQRAALFEPFRRGTSAGRSSRTGGLGLGLYIVRQIVLAHRGTVDVESEDRGTRFVVRLPRDLSSRP